ncbi:hypothetical protein EIP75_21715 [Aquabacterium soli]|uniref:Uncharacterized protein n=1 Tax=Aquabacterium soli TaxID=2493092 RepID=A0A426V2W8_9BURK|nr:hypothetical protein [Aquabacterium soli]RRS01195.1 hypothetical protein EIP75_21715 [Aquabacterium soli]
MMENRTLHINDRGDIIGTSERALGPVIEQNSPFLVFRLSWVAYAREGVALLLRLLVCCIGFMLVSVALQRFTKMGDMSWLTVLGALLAIVWTAYSIAFTNSVRLFTDDAGVWMQSGVFPWEKGVTGVQWRDLGQAGYNQGFVSWILRSYDVQVTHRFSTTTEMYLRNVHRGNLAVEHINQVMAQLQGRVVR